MIGRIVILIPIAVFLAGIFIWIPWVFVKNALSTLVGRPLGFGWQRVDAEIRTAEAKDSAKALVIPKSLVFQYAVYEVGGNEYKTPLTRQIKEEQCMIYVRRKNPQEVWEQKYPDKMTALVGILLIIGIWAGLVLSGIYIVRMMKS